MSSRRSLGRIAGIVGLATLLSKAIGLVRATCVAAVFGVGAVAEAYNYAYIIPSFFLVLIGGLNGPLHTALVSVLAKQSDRTTAEQISGTVSVIVTVILLPLTLAVMGFADILLTWVAPGLTAEIRAIAVPQLQVMAAMILVSGWIGVSLGVLTAREQYWIPSISPALSSLAVIGSLAVFAWRSSVSSFSLEELTRIGGITLAVGTLIGAIAQWALQSIVQWRSGGHFRLLQGKWRSEGVGDVFKIMVPATLSSGLMSINVYVDLLFASYIPKAAAALSYAELLAQAPRGILSSTLLVPLLPAFSRLAAPEQRSQLKAQIRQGLVLAALVSLPLSALLVGLAVPIVRVVYERQAFDADASLLVAALLRIFGIGLFPSLVRDVLVRVFYGLGDGATPFRISLFNIGLNVVLDYWLVGWFSASGLILSSLGINLVAIGLLLISLHRCLEGISWWNWSLPIFKILSISLITSLMSWGVWQGCTLFLSPENWLIQVLYLSLAVGLGLGFFGLMAWKSGLPEVRLLGNRFSRKAPQK
ncbi:MAG: murein biosynthesis integral membrane protein MurJ [Cyanobacteriota bacterium]|nr:murein biosynthesis integral membrane protein MurJ [Cyanobacteriota bacterium]